jgi:hypothetical protein
MKTHCDTNESAALAAAERPSGVVPRAVVCPEALSYHLLRPRQAGPADVPLLGEAYQCWAEVWKQTLLELDNATHVPSDDFTRQDEVGAIFHGYECVALSFFRWIDLGNPMHQDDSYFAAWPREARRAACRDGTRICVGSNITIAPAWRSSTGCSLKNVLAGLIIERFVRGQGDAMVGTMRKDRGMDTLMDRVGAERLGHTVRLHGVDVDLFTFFRRSSGRLPLNERDESVVQSLSSSIQRS